MKVDFLKKAVAFVTAVTMSLGMVTVMPEGVLPQFGIEVSAETVSFTDMPAGDYVYSTLKNGALTISGVGDMWNWPADVDMSYPNYYGYVSSGAAEPGVYRSAVTSIKIGNNITSIGDYAFAGMENVTSINLPEGITYIGTGSFDSCSGLNTVNIPNTVKEIWSNAFISCASLTSVTIPKTVEFIGTDAFAACNSEFVIYCYKDSEAERYAKEENINYVLLDADTTEPENIISSGQCGENVFWILDSKGTLTISGTGDMYDYNSSPGHSNKTPFYYNTDIKNVIINDGVTSIGSDAFYWCINLEDIQIASSVTEIRYGAFYHCNSLTNILIPNGVNKLLSPFGACYSLTSITIPKSVNYTTTTVDLNGDPLYGDISYSIFADCSNELKIYGYKNTYAEDYANNYNITFIALDSNSEFTSAALTDYSESVNDFNVGDKIVFEIFLYDSNNERVTLTDDLDYTVSISDTNVIALEDDMPTDNYINTKAISGGKATITVTFSNGVIASSTVTVKETGNNENTDTTSDSRYEYVYLDSDPVDFVFSYNKETSTFDKETADCSLNLSYLNLLAEEDEYVNISKIEVTPPKGFRINNLGEFTTLTQTFVTPEKLSRSNNLSDILQFTIKVPSAEFYEGNPIDSTYSTALKIVVYGEDGFVKTFERKITVKCITSNPSDDPVIDNEIIYDSDVDGDIVVNDGQNVTIKGNISCNNLYVKGGNCTIDYKSTLTVKKGVEISGGNVTTWLPTDVFDEYGGTLNVEGELIVTDNMIVGKPCGILVMENEDSVVNVKKDFSVLNQSTKYISRLSAGKLIIGGNFKCGIWYGSNFKATGTHTTIFTGTDFTIEIDNKDDASYFQNLSFTQAALDSVVYNGKLVNFDLYRANIMGDFYLYNDKTKDLSYLLKDASNLKDNVLADTYSGYLGDSKFKKSMSGLKDHVSDDFFDKIVADVMFFCGMENMAIATGTSHYTIDFSKCLGDIAGVAGFTNGKTVLVFSEKGEPDVYVCIAWVGQGLGSKKNQSSASLFTMRWVVDKGRNRYESSQATDLISLSFSDVSNLGTQLEQIYRDSTNTNGTVTDYLKWFKDYVLGSYSDLDSVFNAAVGVDGRLDLTKPKVITSLAQKVCNSVINGNFSSFEIKDPYSAAGLPKKIQDFFKSDMAAFDIAAFISCPVDVTISNSNGEVVAEVKNNIVIKSSDDVSIEVKNGDDKYCVFHVLDDYKIILTATDNGTMDYFVYEINDEGINRTVSFEKLPLQKGISYSGEIDNITNQTSLDFALTDNNGELYLPDSDTANNHTHSYGALWKFDSTSHWHECSCGEKADSGRHIPDNGKITINPTATSSGTKTYSCAVCGYVIRTEILPATGGSGNTGGNGNTGSYVPPTTVPSSTPTFPTTIVTRPTLTVKATTKNDTVTLKWNKINNAKKYTVYQLVNGKYVKIKDTDKTSVTFKKLKSGKTYKFLVRYTVNGQKSSNVYSGRISVTVNYKPVVKATATQNSVRLVWDDVPNAQKYAVYKYVNGKAVKLIETKKTSVKINKLAPKTKYQYIVRAYINGKWTTMTKSDIVTATTK